MTTSRDAPAKEKSNVTRWNIRIPGLQQGSGKAGCVMTSVTSQQAPPYVKSSSLCVLPVVVQEQGLALATKISSVYGRGYSL